ncbi:hypothetical protein BDP55DRAFT_688220 [Colletotrichum godetiae]|uniref:Uncharacterized protein n=1 Tax=Colletotrichum godetiae TaxID=1209918 RepID=A0AAJ0ELT8_9PEZI|nr:uncharacterized protein BDP55DRAFT_688220 [Colletotrichum godetiae]KAK1656701.1 hypothetical protein BDP55DRAFT_688220 [Colletotrichum godetiae]
MRFFNVSLTFGLLSLASAVQIQDWQVNDSSACSPGCVRSCIFAGIKSDSCNGCRLAFALPGTRLGPTYDCPENSGFKNCVTRCPAGSVSRDL